MEIHQIQVRYEPLADRLLVQIRTRQEQLFSIWLTRRLTVRLLPHLQQSVVAAALSRSAPGSVAVAEARDMLAAAAREEALRSADFSSPFDVSVAQPALGPEPLLPMAVDLMQDARSGLSLRVRDAQHHSLDLQLGDEFAVAFVQLIESALAQTEWGLAPRVAGNEASQAGESPRVLN